MKLKNFAMITEDKVTENFCIADDFCKVFDLKSILHSSYSLIPQHYNLTLFISS